VLRLWADIASIPAIGNTKSLVAIFTDTSKENEYEENILLFTFYIFSFQSFWTE
jgi:hypothetical protein